MPIRAPRSALQAWPIVAANAVTLALALVGAILAMKIRYG